MIETTEWLVVVRDVYGDTEYKKFTNSGSANYFRDEEIKWEGTLAVDIYELKSSTLGSFIGYVSDPS